MPSFSLGKTYHLKSRKAIAHLHSEGQSLSKYPLFCKFLIVPDSMGSEGPFKVAFSAPKRLFRKAVERNMRKRKMREAFRLTQNVLEMGDQQIHLMFFYNRKDNVDSDNLNQVMEWMLLRINKSIGKKSI